MTTSDYLTVPEVAAILRVADDYVSRQCRAKVIKAKKLGHEWRIHRSSLEAFMLDDSPAPATRTRLSARQQRKSA